MPRWRPARTHVLRRPNSQQTQPHPPLRPPSGHRLAPPAQHSTCSGHGKQPPKGSGMPADGERHASSSSSFPASAQLQQAPGRVHMPPHRPGRTCSASISSRMMCSTRRTMLPITSSAAGIINQGGRGQGWGGGLHRQRRWTRLQQECGQGRVSARTKLGCQHELYASCMQMVKAPGSIAHRLAWLPGCAAPRASPPPAAARAC